MNTFTLAAGISRQYISLKHGAHTVEQWKVLARRTAEVIEMIKCEKETVYAEGPSVHGRFTQSKLDVLDGREFRMCAIFDNCLAN